MRSNEISSLNPYPHQHIDILDTEVAYMETGSGDPIVFLHGNPTTSYLWRNVIPHLESLGRCLAPDLIGAGESGNMPSGSYRFSDHIKYMDEWFEKLKITKNVILVVHDWGAAIGVNRAYRFPEQVKGIVYMEAMVRPRYWSDMPEMRVEIFKKLRSPEGDEMVMNTNYFVEKMLFELGVVRELSDDEKEAYRKPTEDHEKRMMTLQWAREIPFEGEPEDNHRLVKAYSDFLCESRNLPKLFINCEQGHALAGDAREFCRKWPNQTEISFPGRHYVQEDFPHEIGKAIADFSEKIWT
ncbi:MAG: haloalkane dehalogenase [Nitrospina sp.]|nr:haloalkane dehalogenase [Nitrospina sp.]